MTAPEPQHDRLAWVRWLDSCGHHGGWASADDAKAQRPLLIESIGIVVDEGPQHVTLTCSAAANGQKQAPITIPKLAILEWGEFKPRVTKRHRVGG